MWQHNLIGCGGRMMLCECGIGSRGGGSVTVIADRDGKRLRPDWITQGRNDCNVQAGFIPKEGMAVITLHRAGLNEHYTVCIVAIVHSQYVDLEPLDIENNEVYRTFGEAVKMAGKKSRDRRSVPYYIGKESANGQQDGSDV